MDYNSAVTCYLPDIEESSVEESNADVSGNDGWSNSLVELLIISILPAFVASVVKVSVELLSDVEICPYLQVSLFCLSHKENKTYMSRVTQKGPLAICDVIEKLIKVENFYLSFSKKPRRYTCCN